MMVRPAYWDDGGVHRLVGDGKVHITRRSGTGDGLRDYDRRGLGYPNAQSICRMDMGIAVQMQTML